MHNNLKMSGCNLKILKNGYKKIQIIKINCYWKCCVTLKNESKAMLLTLKNTDKHKKSFDAVKSKISIDDELDDLADEYRSFRITKELHCVDKMKILEFWYKLHDVKDGTGQPKTQKFMTNLTVLTHSSACVERIFSQVNLVQTRRKQSLKVTTTRQRILAKQQITKYNNSYKTWKPKPESIKELHNGVSINDIL